MTEFEHASSGTKLQSTWPFLASRTPFDPLSGSKAPAHNDARDVNMYNSTGDPPTDRTIIILLSLVCMMVLSLLIGSRIINLRKHGILKCNITSTLVLLLNTIVMAFIVCSAVMVAGQGLRNHALCVGGTWICLIFYTLAKGIIYIFFVERIHVVRAPFVRRSRDWLYLSCMVIVLLALIGQCVNTYIHAITEMRESDGRCLFGIPQEASIPGLVIDAAGGLGLTCLLLYLLRPITEDRGSAHVTVATNPGTAQPDNERNETAVQRNIRMLLWKSMIGSIAIVIPTTANMIQFVVMKGRELGMICLSICMVDLTWDAAIIHWLTCGSSAEAEGDLTYSMEASMSIRPCVRTASTEIKSDGDFGLKLTHPRSIGGSRGVYALDSGAVDASQNCV